MKLFFVLVIRFYWHIIPVQKRRSCIYSISCSKHVMNTLQEQGFLAGFKQFIYRYKNCKGGYTIKSIDDSLILFTAKNHTIKRNDINPSIVKIFNESRKINLLSALNNSEKK